jgi:glycerate dehydrogenase
VKASQARKSPKIVFLDAATLDLGDLNLKKIRDLGFYHSLPRCPGNQIPQEVRDADILITNKVVLGEKEMKIFPRLHLICVSATGVNNIDLAAARRLGIAVTNVAGYSTPTVVEHTLMFLLALSHRLKEHDDAVKNGTWSRSPLFALLDFPYGDLAGKTLGIVGYGTIGKKVGRLATALGMKVRVARLPGRNYDARTKRRALNQILKESDFVSIHTALTPSTQGLINRKRLSLMKPSAYLLNLARGPVVVEKDVAQALEKNKIAGFAADVTEIEPLPKNHPFLKKSLANKLLLTPHIAWASRESRQRLVNEIAANIASFQQGRRRNRVE